MTGSDRLLNEIDADLRRATRQRVLYLEGKTDVEPFFALLGVTRPRSDEHQGVLVRGLKDEGERGRAPGTGSEVVRRRVMLAFETGRSKVHGLVDGDGRTIDEMAEEFGRPQLGPVFVWDGYCIENQLPRVAWPSGWGAAPVWDDVLREYAPYVALNRVGLALRRGLETLRLHKFQNPRLGAPLLGRAEVEQMLAAERHGVEGVDVVARFGEQLDFFLRVGSAVQQGHLLLYGKWLLHHYAVTRSGASIDECRAVWCAAVREAGGSPDVQAWWDRLFN